MSGLEKQFVISSKQKREQTSFPLNYTPEDHIGVRRSVARVGPDLVLRHESRESHDVFLGPDQVEKFILQFWLKTFQRLGFSQCKE